MYTAGGQDRNACRLHNGGRLLRIPNCGGNWNNGANAGVFYVNGNNERSNTNDNIGFRSALLSQAGGCQIIDLQTCERIKESVSTPI